MAVIEARKRYPPTGVAVQTLSISPSGEQAVSTSLEWQSAAQSGASQALHHTIRIWDFGADTIARMSVPHERASSLVVARDHSRLIAKHAYGKTEFLELATGRSIGKPDWPEALHLESSAHLTNGEDLVGLVAPGTVARVDLTGIRWRRSAPEYKSGNVAALFATPERIVLACASPNRFSVLDAESGAELERYRADLDPDYCLLAPGGARMLSRAKGKSVSSYISVRTGKNLRRPLLRKEQSAFAFSPDASLLAAADADGNVALLTEDATVCVTTFASGLSTPRLAWIADGSGLVIADGRNGALGIWSTTALLPETTQADR